MKKILVAFLLLTLFSNNAIAKEKAHFVAWGDEEGVIKRPGDDINDKNEALPVLMKHIERLDETKKIDAILHVGDFVRFDPNETYYKKFLGDKFLDRFYPTTGGDQEFYFGRYLNFVKNVPHLKKLWVDRAIKDGNGNELYYHTIVKNTHIISLYSPDEYRDKERNPEYTGQNFYASKNVTQYKWLENTLKDIRINKKDSKPIIVISHGPIFNGSKILLELFAQYKVNLVLNGDAHILAYKEYKGTKYFVTGMAGDRALGSCEPMNDKKYEFYTDDYSFCIPEKDMFRKKGEKFIFNKDHYLDIYIDENDVEVHAIEIETGSEINYK